MAVSIGDKIDLQEIEQVITPPVEENVFLAASYDDMYNAMRKLAEDSCQFSSGIFQLLTSYFIYEIV